MKINGLLELTEKYNKLSSYIPDKYYYSSVAANAYNRHIDNLINIIKNIKQNDDIEIRISWIIANIQLITDTLFYQLNIINCSILAKSINNIFANISRNDEYVIIENFNNILPIAEKLKNLPVFNKLEDIYKKLKNDDDVLPTIIEDYEDLFEYIFDLFEIIDSIFDQIAVKADFKKLKNVVNDQFETLKTTIFSKHFSALKTYKLERLEELMDEFMDPEDRDNPEMIELFNKGEYL